jgi:hypothetical protein
MIGPKALLPDREVCHDPSDTRSDASHARKLRPMEAYHTTAKKPVFFAIVKNRMGSFALAWAEPE